jgi:tetratricopeptide (TPR) repeat protein
MNNTLRDAAIACACAFLFGPSWAAARQASPPAKLDSAQVAAWRDDLRFMAAEMARQHRNLYHTVPRTRFDSAVAALNRRIPSLARHEIIVEMARIVALVGDGHTNIAPTRDSVIGFRSLPVRLYLFKDGLFVRSATRDHADLAGARVIRVGRATPEEAYARVRELIGKDNEMDARFFAPFLLAMPEVLHGLGLVDNMERIPFVIERNGRRATVLLAPAGPARMMPPDTDVSWWPESGWVDMRDSTSAPPLWLSQDPNDHYWFKYLQESRTVYVQYNKVGNKEPEGLVQFSDRLLSFVDSAAVDRLVLDLRLNRGGNGSLNRPLLLALIKARKLDGPGKLFTIIGRSTFSAAQFMINEVEQYTDAVFVGEPSGGKVNSYGDSRKIVLPHSGITVRVSIYWWQEHPADNRPWKAPDIAAELTSADYRSNVDPALAGALAYHPEPSLGERMADALAAEGVHGAARRYRQYRADPRHAYAETENELNDLGYKLIKDRLFEEAIVIFELNVAEHPSSSNGYDSLGEAYMLAGKRELAVRSYRKSLALDPSNTNARIMLEKLGR